MARTSSLITIEEIPGTDFPDLAAAQRSARAILADDLARSIKRLIENGKLEIVENQICPKGK